MGNQSGPNPISSISGQEAGGAYGFVNPIGSATNLSSALYGPSGVLSNGPLGMFNSAAPAITEAISGMSGPLAQSLSESARYMANNALNTTASNFANMGALKSGAGAQAFGQAVANPFAQALSGLQSAQLGAGSQALSSLLGVSGNVFGQGLQSGQDLASTTSGLVAPQYYTNPIWAAQQQQMANNQQGKQQMTSQMMQLPLMLSALK